jgi:transposase
VLSFAGALKVYLAVEPQDMRKSFNGLNALVSDHLRMEPTNGALYVFTNRRRNRLKILFWDGSGMWVATKRLEEGRFSWPKPSEKSRKLSLSPEALSLLTDGVDLKGARLKPWYQRD